MFNSLKIANKIKNIIKTVDKLKWSEFCKIVSDETDIKFIDIKNIKNKLAECLIDLKFDNIKNKGDRYITNIKLESSLN